MKRHLLASIVLLLTCAATASAQNAFRLTLEKPPSLKHGRVVVVGGVSNPKGHRTFLENLSVLQPIDIALLTLNTDDDVELALAKDHYDKPLMAGSTKGKGFVRHKLRTEGEMRFTVTAKGEPKPYRLIVWAGDPVKIPVRSALVTRRPTRSRWPLIAGMAAAVAVLGIAGAWMWKRRKPSVLVLLVLAFSSSVVAQGPFRSDPAPFLETPTTAGEWAERAREVADGFGWSQPGDALDWWNEHTDFTPDDSSYIPDFDPDGTPELPVACGLHEATADACRDCYQRAQDRLNGVRTQLERLRALYESTDRYVKASISFGDSTSGVHAVSGLAWQVERRGIMAEFAKFERTHESKRQDMMRALRDALDALAACEAEHFNNPDWFNRYGFMYFQFMEARYKK